MEASTVGRVISISDRIQVSNNEKITVIIDDGGEKYPNPLSIEFFGSERCDDIDAQNLQPGDSASVKVYVKGREWEDKQKGTTKFFTNLSGASISASSRTPLQERRENRQPRKPQTMDSKLDRANLDGDDIPF